MQTTEDTTIEQLDFISTIAGDRNYGTLNFYETLPRFRHVRISDQPNIEKSYTYKGQQYKATIWPQYAGNAKFQYAGEREEIVESALRYLLLTHNQSARQNGQQPTIHVDFTNKELREILAQHGHNFNSKEIDAAIRCLSQCRFEINTIRAGRWECYQSPIPYITTLSANDTTQPDAICYRIQFNDIAAKSLLNLDFTPCSLSTELNLGSILARWLFRRLHNPLRAEHGYYTFSTDEINAESPISTTNLRNVWPQQVRPALQSLVEQGVITSTPPELLTVAKILPTSINGFETDSYCLRKRVMRKPQTGKGRPAISNIIYIVRLTETTLQSISRIAHIAAN